jgi:hypothetical protein
MRRLTLSLALVLLVGNHAVQAQASSDLWTGTRHLVIAKSTFRHGPAPKERTSVIEAVDGGIKMTVTGTQADGTPVNFTYTAKFDGKYYPVMGRDPVDSTSFRRVTAHRLESKSTDGKDVETSTFVLSKDGRVLTLALTDPDGKKSDVLVFKK